MNDGMDSWIDLAFEGSMRIQPHHLKELFNSFLSPSRMPPLNRRRG
jgi:hypothetical protein